MKKAKKVKLPHLTRTCDAPPNPGTITFRLGEREVSHLFEALESHPFNADQVLEALEKAYVDGYRDGQEDAGNGEDLSEWARRGHHNMDRR